MDALRKKIENLLRDKNISLANASLQMGKNVAYMHQFINKGSPVELPEEQREKLAFILGVDEQELTNRTLNRSVTNAPNSSIVRLEMLDATACCGEGVDNYAEPVIGSWAMPAIDFHALSNTAPQNVKIIKAIGDSMTPTIADGDYVFVDISNPFVSSDGLYVLRLPNGLSIKRIQNGIKGDITIRSDNPQYDPITALAGEVKVLGRVIYIFNGKKA